MSDRSAKEGFGEANLGEAQSEQPPEDPEMIESEGESTEDGKDTEESAAVPPRGDRSDIEQSERAAQEAGAIGGHVGSAGSRGEEERPVSEGGGGESEGFELAEEELEESASHGTPSGDPATDRFPPEDEDPEAHTIHGEADDVDSTSADGER